MCICTYQASHPRTMSESLVLEENEGYMWVPGLTAEERQEGKWQYTN